jgi:hypothetical protein
MAQASQKLMDAGLETDTASNVQSQRQWLNWVSAGITIAVVVFAGYASFRPLFSGTPWMLFFEDDFFYYLKVAQNLAHGGGSTFNGIVPTNGYHPLWFLVLTGLSLISTRPQVILGFVGAILFISTVAIYLLTRRLLTCYGVTLVLASGLAAYATSYCMRILFGGMEVVLTVPLVLLVVLMARSPTLFDRGWREFCWLGLACSAMILSRLDTALLATMILMAVLAKSELRKRFTPAAVGGLAVGFIPVVAYFASNVFWFGMLLPVSGAAKQLKFNYLPSAPAWKSVFDRPPSQLLNFVPVVVAILLLPMLRKRLSALDRAVVLPALIFPFVYVLILSCRSDWQLWGWYFYAFRTAFCVSLAVLVVVPAVRVFLERPLVVAFALIAVFRMSQLAWGIGGHEEIYGAAVDLQAFAGSHPGVYAMGDRAGMPAYLMANPMIQTEGLVMDGRFLDSVRREEPLGQVLARYHVRYYVGSSHAPASGCFAAVEPAQAGPASPHMRGEFCQPPVATYHHGDVYTLVYDLVPPPP